MSNKKQSSVDWLVDEFVKYMGDGFKAAYKDEIEKARAMHREEIESAYRADRTPCSEQDCADYYNQTFESDGK